MQLLLDGVGERLGRGTAVCTEPPSQARCTLLGCRQRGCGSGDGVGAALEGCQLGARFRGARQELCVGLATIAPFRVCNPVELRLHLLQPVGLSFERLEEPSKLERCLAQANLDVTQLAGGTCQLGCDRGNGL